MKHQTIAHLEEGWETLSNHILLILLSFRAFMISKRKSQDSEYHSHDRIDSDVYKTHYISMNLIISW